MGAAPGTEGYPPPSIYASFEALQAYLSEVQTRRAERREARRREIEASIEAVRCERLAAEADGDADIAAELLAVEQRFERMIETPTAESAGLEPSAAAAEPLSEAQPIAELRPTPTPEQLADLDARIEGIGAQASEFLAQGVTRGDGSTDRSRLFALRAMGARVRALHAEAEAIGALEIAGGKALTVLTDLDGARPGANDRFAAAPFTHWMYGAGEQAPAPEDWNTLADAYGLTAEAQEAWEWFGGRAAAAGDTDPTPLLNAIAARQQMLFRALGRMGADDELQLDFYVRLKDHARRTSHFLKTLEQQCSDATLAQEAGLMEERRARFEESIKRVAAQREIVERCEAAIRAVEDWHGVWGPCREEAASLEASREALEPLLRACAEAKVPPTNVRVRSALLDRGLELLAADGPFAKVREAVAQERRRRGLDTVEEADAVEEPLDDEMLALAEQVAPHTRDRSVLIVGGVPRATVVNRLAPLLQAEVRWLQCEKNDKPAKFRTAIEHADILLVLKNLTGHSTSEKGRDWVKAKGGQFVLVTAGHGAKQLLHRLREHFATSRNGEPVEP
ncbi:MAG TPA: hypothetical protein VLH79_12010 [Chthonomonadales bacterium]|nr:hypothetical protein [Chthonomonadales bacterium]